MHTYLLRLNDYYRCLYTYCIYQYQLFLLLLLFHILIYEPKDHRYVLRNDMMQSCSQTPIDLSA